MPRGVYERKSRVVEIKQPEQHYCYPTLTMRQAGILFACIREGMANHIEVDHKFVDAEEWKELIRAVWR